MPESLVGASEGCSHCSRKRDCTRFCSSRAESVFTHLERIVEFCQHQVFLKVSRAARPIGVKV